MREGTSAGNDATQATIQKRHFLQVDKSSGRSLSPTWRCTALGVKLSSSSFLDVHIDKPSLPSLILKNVIPLTKKE